MNLKAIISLWAGGPGSGCNPDKAQPRCGRPSGTGAGASGDANSVIESYKPVFNQFNTEMHSLLDGLGTVETRLKTADSIAEKVQRKGGAPEKLTDVIGGRVTVNSIKDLSAAVSRVKAAYKVTQEEDYISKPKDGMYRAYHLLVDIGGKTAEVQVRTANQSKLAVWMHDSVYKGALRFSNVAKDYAKQWSDYLYNLDMGGRVSNPPGCPPEILPNCFSIV